MSKPATGSVDVFPCKLQMACLCWFFLGALSVSSQTPTRVRVGKDVQSANLISTTDPVYPPAAKNAGVQGIVPFNAVIGRDGTLMSLEPVTGPPVLIDSARDAVMRWTYKPVLLNDQPVEVATQIDVPFVLSVPRDVHHYMQQPFAQRTTMVKTPEYDKLDVYFNDDGGSGRFRGISRG